MKVQISESLAMCMDDVKDRLKRIDEEEEDSDVLENLASDAVYMVVEIRTAIREAKSAATG